MAETTVAYYYTGTEQAFTVPAGVTSLHVVAVGARGGRGGSSGAAAGGPGGYGATVTADIPVVPGTMLYVEVGGSGADAPNASSGIVIGGVGGFNNEAGS